MNPHDPYRHIHEFFRNLQPKYRNRNSVLIVSYIRYRPILGYRPPLRYYDPSSYCLIFRGVSKASFKSMSVVQIVGEIAINEECRDLERREK